MASACASPGPALVDEEAVKRLNAALVDEIVRAHLRRDPGVRSEDQRRANLIAERIVRLGGQPDYSSLRLVLRGRANL